MVDAVPRVAQGVVGPSPAPAGVVLGELAQERAELLVDLVDDDGESLGRATLTNNGAGPAFRNPELLFECNDHSTAAVRGQNFPSATYFNMSMSSAWLATMRFS